MTTPKRASEPVSLRHLARELRLIASKQDALHARLDNTRLQPHVKNYPDVDSLPHESLLLRNVATELEVWANILGRGAK